MNLAPPPAHKMLPKTCPVCEADCNEETQSAGEMIRDYKCGARLYWRRNTYGVRGHKPVDFATACPVPTVTALGARE